MKNLQSFLIQAKTSKLKLFLLNIFLAKLIPFNKPHAIKIKELSDDYCVAELPYRRSNCNHLRGLHACALATTAEFCAGIFLLMRIDPKNYRLIMKELKAEYFSQARTTVYAKAGVSKEEYSRIITSLENTQVAEVKMDVELHDQLGKLLARVNVLWQVKDWKVVKSKV